MTLRSPLHLEDGEEGEIIDQISIPGEKSNLDLNKYDEMNVYALGGANSVKRVNGINEYLLSEKSDIKESQQVVEPSAKYRRLDSSDFRHPSETNVERSHDPERRKKRKHKSRSRSRDRNRRHRDSDKRRKESESDRHGKDRDDRRHRGNRYNSRERRWDEREYRDNINRSDGRTRSRSPRPRSSPPQKYAGDYDYYSKQTRNPTYSRDNNYYPRDDRETEMVLQQETEAQKEQNGNQKDSGEKPALMTPILSTSEVKALTVADVSPTEEIAISNDEAEERLIEERRQKRLAILQKYKSKESSPFSDKVVPSSASNVSISPVSVSVLAAGQKSTSPIDVESSNVKTGSESPEENIDMSAADYDPNADKIEDENRIAFLHGGRRSSNVVEKTKNENGDDDMFAPLNETENDDDIDIFGPPKEENKDDDDDMFSMAPKQGPKEVTHILDSKKIVRSENLALADNWDDADGYYRLMLGEMLDNRYHVYANLGKGVFSCVVKAKDTLDQDKDVAIKIIRNNDTMYRAGMKELNILKKLSTIDPEDKKHVVRLKRHFEHRNHLCIVFESLSMNLRDVIKKFGKERGLHIKAVRSYAHQLFLALSLLKKGNVLHADIKPDNVLVAENNITLKLCDLGSASDASENEITPYLVSRFYRAPEIMLGLPYDFGIDIWSVACTLYELYTGKILFPGKSNNQMLKLIQEAKGRFTSKQLRKAQFASQHFDLQDPSNAFLSVEHSKTTGKDVVKRIVFKQPERDIKSKLMGQLGKRLPAAESDELMSEAAMKMEEENRMVKDFADLLEKCLVLNPEKRLTVAEALRHPFIFGSKQ